MTQRRYEENMGYQLMLQIAQNMPREGAPIEDWMTRAGIGSKKFGDENPMLDTGSLPPKDTARRVMRRLIREAEVEPVPGQPNLYRPVVDYGRNVGKIPTKTIR